MANVSMNLGDKLIFDANDSTPNTTWMRNPAGSTNPNNTIEVVTNGSVRVVLSDAGVLHFPSNRPLMIHGGSVKPSSPSDYYEFLTTDNAKVVWASLTHPFLMTEFAVQATDILMEGRVVVKKRGTGTGSGDIEFTEPTAKLRCVGGVSVFLSAHGPQADGYFRILSGDPDGTHGEWFRQDQNRMSVQTGIRLFATTTVNRTIDTDVGDIKIAAETDVILVANRKATHGGSKVKVYDGVNLVATMEDAGAVFNVKVDASSGGVRTRTVAAAPTGGDSGDLAIRTDGPNIRLYANVEGTWRYVALT